MSPKLGPKHTDSRDRVVAAAAEMLAQHGLNATSIREMVKRAEAPLGSTYHHFPGGKYQVVVESVLYAGARASAGLDHHLQAGPVAGLRAFLDMYRDVLIRSEFRRGCPVMAAAVEEPIEQAAEAVLAAAAQVFTDWEQKLIHSLESAGLDHNTAVDLATLMVASVEGAIALCRAQRSIAPLDRVAKQLESLVQQKIDVRD